MKLSAFVAILALLPGCAFSQSDQVLNICSGRADIAQSVMRNRQHGAQMSEMMKIAADFDKKADHVELNDGHYGNMKRLVISAYDRPAMRVESNKQHEIERFRDSVYMDCIKTLM